MNAGGRGVGIAAEGVTVVVLTVLVLEQVFWEYLHVSMSARLQYICSSYIARDKYFKRLYSVDKIKTLFPTSGLQNEKKGAPTCFPF